MKIKDLNGTYGFRHSKINQFRDELEDDKGFLPTEIAIYGRKFNLKIVEIHSENQDFRNTSNLFVLRVGLITLMGLRVKSGIH